VLSGEGEECLFPTKEIWRHIETVVSFLERFYKLNELFDNLDYWSDIVYVDLTVARQTVVGIHG
jgi:hypothetical protein